MLLLCGILSAPLCPNLGPFRYDPRLPIGFLLLETAGTMLAGSMTQHLYDGSVDGVLTTSVGEIRFRAFTSCGNFDIIWGHVSRVSQLFATPHTSRGVLYGLSIYCMPIRAIRSRCYAQCTYVCRATSPVSALEWSASEGERSATFVQ